MKYLDRHGRPTRRRRVIALESSTPDVSHLRSKINPVSGKWTHPFQSMSTDSLQAKSQQTALAGVNTWRAASILHALLEAFAVVWARLAGVKVWFN